MDTPLASIRELTLRLPEGAEREHAVAGLSLSVRAVISRGEIVELKSAAELFKSPEHAYTKALLAAVPGRARS